MGWSGIIGCGIGGTPADVGVGGAVNGRTTNTAEEEKEYGKHVIFWVEVASLVATLVGLRVALESLLHSMVGPSPQAKSKTLVTVKVRVRVRENGSPNPLQGRSHRPGSVARVWGSVY